MNTLAGTISASLFLLSSSMAFGQPDAQSQNITCQPSGYDIILHNSGSAPIAEGTMIEWSVPFARMEGSHHLLEQLEPGQKAFLTGVLGSNFLSSSVSCQVVIS